MEKYIWIAVLVVLTVGAYMLFKKNRQKNNNAALAVREKTVEKETAAKAKLALEKMLSVGK